MNWIGIILTVLSLFVLVTTILVIYLLLKKKPSPCSNVCANPTFQSITLGEDGIPLSNNDYQAIDMTIRSSIVSGTHTIYAYKLGNSVTLFVPAWESSDSTKSKNIYGFITIPEEYRPKADISFPIAVQVGGWMHTGFAAITASTGEIAIFYSNNGQAGDFPIGYKIGNRGFNISYYVE